MNTKEREKFRAKYPALYTLLSMYIAVEEDDALEQFVDEEDHEKIVAAIKEGQAFLKDEVEFRNNVDDLINRSFKSTEESLEWLSDILDEIEKMVNT